MIETAWTRAPTWLPTSSKQPAVTGTERVTGGVDLEVGAGRASTPPTSQVDGHRCARAARPTDVSIRLRRVGSPQTSMAAYDRRSRRASRSQRLLAATSVGCGQWVEPPQVGHDAARATRRSPYTRRRTDPLQRDRERAAAAAPTTPPDEHGAERAMSEATVDRAAPRPTNAAPATISHHQAWTSVRRTVGSIRRAGNAGSRRNAAEHRRGDEQGEQWPG